jgi:hypothetical protein
MTGDEKYLKPLRSMGALRLAWIKNRPKETPQPGSPMWCARKMGFLAGTLAKYRLLTGSHEFDELLEHDYVTLAVEESDVERTSLTEALHRSVLAMRVNVPAFTSEVRFTDRVFAFPRMFRNDMMFAETVAANSQSPNPPLLYTTATGDRGQFAIFPLNAVRWLTPPREIAALVTRSGRDRFSAQLFHFGSEKRSMSAEFYLLQPGRYRMQIGPRDGEPDSPSDVPPPIEFTVTGPRTKVAFELPPRKLCVLRIDPRR